jgi:hypothetical protein
MLKTTLKKILHTDTATLLEELGNKLIAVRESKDSARILLGEAVEGADADAMAEFEKWSKEETKITARIEGLHRREAELQSKEKAAAKQKIDAESDAAISALTAFAEKEIESMLADMAHTLARFIVLRNAVLETAAAAKNAEALRRAQDSTSVLNYFLQRTIRPLTGVRSTDDPTRGRSFADYLRDTVNHG